MSKTAKKEALLDYTMRTVAENGMMSFSMQMVTKMAGTAEGLIYKHYHNKENLLLQCYLQIYQEIKNCLEDGLEVPKVETKEEMFAFLRTLWIKYYNFLINNEYKTLFFYEYRNSSYMKDAVAKGKINPKKFFNKTVELFYSFDKQFHILKKIDLKSFFIYVTDVSIIFAIRIINEGTQCDESMCENIWKLIWGGEFWLLNH